MLRRVGLWLWFLSAAVIVSLAVAVSSARLLLPGMADYKAELEALAGRQLQHSVAIGSLSASWRGVSPALSLRDVRVADERLEGGALEIGEVQIAVDVWRSLLNWRWQTRSLDIGNLSVRLYRQLDGRWSLFDTPAPEATDDWLDQLLAQGRIGFRDAQVTLVDRMRGGLTRVFRDVEFMLVNDGNRHQFSLTLALPGTLGHALQLAGDFHGVAADLSAWVGQLYVDVEGANLRQWAEYLPDLELVPGGSADAELWVRWAAGGVQRAGGRLRLDAFSLSEDIAEAPTYSLQRLAGRFLWSRTDWGWRAEADEVELRRAGGSALDAVALGADWHADGRQFRLAANRLPLFDVGRLVRLAPGARPAVRDWLDRLEPRGLAEDVEIDARLADPARPRVAFNARFSRLSTASYGRIPGLSGLSGDASGNLLAGTLRFDTGDAVFNAPELFREPLAVTRLYGGLGWTRYTDRLRVAGDGIQLDTGDVATRTRLTLDWIGDDPVPWIDLQSAFDRVALAAVPRYLPAGIMPAKTVAWLDAALVAGQATNARFTLQGPANRLPFRGGEGILLAGFDFDDVTLAYHPDWGRLERLNGRADFENVSMRVAGDEGHILDTNVRRVVATIDDFFEPSLHVEGTVDGQLPAMTGYVQTTPLASRFAALFEALRAGGDAGLQLDLTVPLKQSSGESTRVRGDLALQNSRLAHRDGLFELTDIQGNIRFSEHAVSAEGVKARLDDAPVSVDIGEGSHPGETLVTVDGPVDLVKRVRGFGWPIGAELEGRADSRVRVRFPDKPGKGDPPLEVKLESDLRGIGSLLPAPFGKLKDDARAFTLQWVPGYTDRWPIQLRLGDDVEARVLLDARGQVRTGILQFGSGSAKLPAKREFLISGHVASARPLPWGKLFAGAGSGTGTGAGKGGAPFPPLRFDLSVDHLSLFDYDIAGVRLTTAEADPWRFRVDGKDTAGDLHFGFAAGGSLEAIEAKLDRLTLGVPDRKTLDAQKTRMRSMAPGSVPRLAFDIGSLTWGDKPLGRVSLETAAVERGVDIKRLQLESDALVADASGQWYLVQGVQSTRLSIDVRGGTLERLLRLFGDTQSIAGGPLGGSLHATWNGSPADFSLSGLQGELRVDLGEGRLVDVKPGPGKLLGLLSLQSLPRRLSLDFTDLFKKGFSFDTIKGDFQLTEMNAYTDNLHISGPAADIYIAGRTGLVQQDYDENITVVPRLTSTLPIAGAIAGGPAVGAAVLLAEQLLGDQVNKMSKVEYRVTGGWADPQYERIDKKPAKTGTNDQDLFE